MVMRKFKQYLVAVAALIWLVSCETTVDNSAELLENIESGNVLLQLKAIDEIAIDREGWAVPTLIELLDSPFEQVRLKSVFALGEIRSQEAVPALIGLLDDEGLAVRREVVTALGKLRNPEALPSLIHLLVDEDLELAVIWAMGNIGDKSVVPILNVLLASDNPYVRYNAARALAKLE